MSRVQYYAAASLDGFISRPDGSIDWLQTYGADSDLGDGPMSDGSYDEFYAGVGALVMGSATYEWILEHAKAWPYDRPAWVFTGRDLPQPPGGRGAFRKRQRRRGPRRGDGSRGRQERLDGRRREPRLDLGRRGIDRRDHSSRSCRCSSARECPSSRGLSEESSATSSTKTHANGMAELTYRMPQ